MGRGLLFLLLLAGCEDDPMLLPPPPDDGGIVRPPGGSRRDGGGGGDASADAGDAGADPCVVVAPGDSDNGATVTVAGSGDPVDFVPTRAYVRWNAAACVDPTLLVALTAGACEPGIGERIVFQLREEGIGTVLRPGPATLSPELQEALGVRYVVPAGGEGPAATWGDCAGAEGELEFVDVGSLPGERIALRFDLLLSDCDAAVVDPLLSVTGSIDLTVSEAFEDVCPAP
jgi:hypothetical protein